MSGQLVCHKTCRYQPIELDFFADNYHIYSIMDLVLSSGLSQPDC